MIKVVHFLPSVNYTSGIINMMMNYYRKIDTSKIQFDFLCFGKQTYPNYQNEIEKLGGKVYKVSTPLNMKQLNKDLNEYFQKQDKFDIIFHNHQMAFTVFLYPIVKRFQIKSFIVHNHTSKYSDKLFSAIRNYILCVPIRYMPVECFACSDEAGQLLFGKRKMNSGKVFIMNNGIDCDKFVFNQNARSRIRKELGIQENDVVFGNIGRYEPVKNHEMIINIFKNIYDKYKNVKLILIGNANGSEREKVVQLIEKFGLNHVVVMLENRNDIPDLLFAMDIFLFPSKFEGLGIAAVEAQAAGVNVLMSDRVPSQVNIINCHVLGLEERIDNWTQKAIDIMKCKTNRYYANTCMKESIFNIDKNVDMMERVYTELI